MFDSVRATGNLSIGKTRFPNDVNLGGNAYSITFNLECDIKKPFFSPSKVDQVKKKDQTTRLKSYFYTNKADILDHFFFFFFPLCDLTDGDCFVLQYNK